MSCLLTLRCNTVATAGDCQKLAVAVKRNGVAGETNAVSNKDDKY